MLLNGCLGAWAVGEENTGFPMFKQLYCLTKNRFHWIYLCSPIQQMFIESLLWAMCWAEWWENRLTKRKSLTSRRFHLGENTDKKRVNFNVFTQRVSGNGVVWKKVSGLRLNVCSVILLPSWTPVKQTKMVLSLWLF